MKNSYIYLLFLFFAFLSCSTPANDNIIVETPVVANTNTLELYVNGQKENEQLEIINASYFDCDTKSFSISVDSKVNGISSYFKLDVTRDGIVRHMDFVDKKTNLSSVNYSTPDYISSSSVQLTTFEFNELKRTVHLKFKATLYKESYNLYLPTQSILVEGELIINKLSIGGCGVHDSHINLDNNIKFDFIGNSYSGNNLNSMKYYDYSNNGYYISINNLNDFIYNKPLGTYTFGILSNTERIDFKKYIGTPKVYSYGYFLPSDWIDYQTSGSFIIEEKSEMFGGQKFVRGKLTLQVFEDGNLIHTFTDIPFAI